FTWPAATLNPSRISQGKPLIMSLGLRNGLTSGVRSKLVGNVQKRSLKKRELKKEISSLSMIDFEDSTKIGHCCESLEIEG
ncbi:MAG: hypothetical protein QNJ55_21960, partial [Xenococcus sp. MO_188.B8]|nr:hypothetical protein [Xenococcus sp. MO_188.B8]